MAVERSEAPGDGRADRTGRHARPNGNPESLPTNYKWMALFILTLGMQMANIDSSIVLISLPNIFRGIGIKPPRAGQYLLPVVDDPRVPGRHQRPSGHVRPDG